MWKISRHLFFSRWSRKQQKYVENNRCSAVSKTISSFSSAEKKGHSDQDHRKEQQFKQNERFWNCKNIRFLLYKTSMLERASWLGTVTILCFNFHFKHLQFMREYESGRSNCLLARHVFAVPQEILPLKIKEKTEDRSSINENSEEILSKIPFVTDDKIKSEEPSIKGSFLDELRNISIQYTVAVHNSCGLHHLKTNEKKAFRHFQKAAGLGSSQAFYNLGLCYELGRGTKINLTRAAFCYKKAAMNGHGLASFNLAVFFMKGEGGLPVDLEVAKHLLVQAAEKNVPEAKLYIGLDYLEHEQYHEAFKVFKALSENNVLDGRYYLGLCYENGWGVNKDERLAAELFSQAATAGHEKSILKLSNFYEEGIGGCDRDIDFSTALCQLLTNQRNEECKTTLLRLYLKKATIWDKKTFNENLPSKNTAKIMRNSSSVPELKLYQNKKCKIRTEPLAAQSCSDLITSLLPVKTDTNYSEKNMFYIGDNRSAFKFTISSTQLYQFNIPHVMVAKS